MAKKSFCETFSQAYLSSTNALVLLCGIGIAVLGTYIMFYPGTFAKGFFGVSVALLAVGAILTIISFLAFCGVLMESRRITYAYIFIVTIIILAEGTIIWYCVSQKDNSKIVAKEIWDMYTAPIRDGIENSNECCGYSSTSESPQCLKYDTTCKDKFESTVSSVYLLIIWAVSGVTAFEILNLMLAVLLKRYYIKTLANQEVLVIDEELDPEELEKGFSKQKMSITGLDELKVATYSSY